MSRSLRVVWDEALAAYDFGPGHPLAPIRVDLTIALAREMGVLDRANVSVAGVEEATDEELCLVHHPEYVAAVRQVDRYLQADEAHGLGTPDNPLFRGMHHAAALVAGASLAAARAVWEGEAEHAANVAGGLHHAMATCASGFCVYNDPAIAIAWLLEQGAERVAYVDIDVHHGDGVQAAFYDDPRVLTISLHESPLTLFPGTGFPDEVGGPNAKGCSVNVPLPAGTGDAGWLRAFHAVVPDLLRAFRPQVLLTQHGCDSHALDPLAHLALTVDGQRAAYAELHRLAHETAGGRWVATGGGGYELVQVVPRVWTHLLAEAGRHAQRFAQPPVLRVDEGPEVRGVDLDVGATEAGKRPRLDRRQKMISTSATHRVSVVRRLTNAPSASYSTTRSGDCPWDRVSAATRAPSRSDPGARRWCPLPRRT